MFEQIIQTYKQTGFFHHGYLIVGEREIIKSVLHKTLELVGEGADVIWENHETFGIDQSRKLVERSSCRNWSGKKEFIILTAKSYTPEAQNALLKLFEEPRPRLHFFLLGNRVTDFLSTLQSRLVIIEHPVETELNEKTNEVLAQVLQFLSIAPVDRLVLIDKNLKNEMKREEWLNFFNVLEKTIRRLKPFPEQSLVELSAIRPYFANPAFLPRLIFEHLAFVLPRVIE